MKLEVAKQIKQAAEDLSLGNNVRLIEDYGREADGKPTAAIGVFNFAYFVQSVARAAIFVAEADETLYSEECEAFVDALDNLRQDFPGHDIVIY